METYGSLIGGEWLKTGQDFESINPSDTTEVVGRCFAASKDECDRAIRVARDALAGWSQSGLEQRKAALDFIGNELIERSEEIGRILSREEGKPLAEGIGEVYRSGQFFQYFGAEVLRQMGENAASVRPNVNVEVTREPVGVVGIITPLELSDRGCRVENCACAGVREYGCPEAG